MTNVVLFYLPTSHKPRFHALLHQYSHFSIFSPPPQHPSARCFLCLRGVNPHSQPLLPCVGYTHPRKGEISMGKQVKSKLKMKKRSIFKREVKREVGLEVFLGEMCVLFKFFVHKIATILEILFYLLTY